MKILIVGDWHSNLHEEPLYRALLKENHEALKFQWYNYFIPNGNFKWLKSILLRIQNKYRLGPSVKKINLDLLLYIKEKQPEVIFFYRSTHIYSKTVKKLSLENKDIILIGYNNDNPFSPMYPKWVWRHFKASIRFFDLVLAYRISNIDEYLAIAAKSVKLFRSWYLPEINNPIVLSDIEKKIFSCDVAFIGHYENDGREEYLESILENKFSLNLFGPGYDWDPVIRKNKLLKSKIPVKLVWGDDYNKAIVGSRIALCFLSKLNRDTYTRRCFEIPASGTMLLAEYSDDLASLFKEGKEIEFFRNKGEMIEKIKFYLDNHFERERISKAGLLRVRNDGHDVNSRAKDLISWIEQIIINKEN